MIEYSTDTIHTRPKR